ncbi:amino acid permease [Peribacillus butanolivorans]|uniref:amino acid permease n=1 Tax=Peribacillus butanolivorans TaxID=421767 RepID=UPI0030CA0159
MENRAQLQKQLKTRHVTMITIGGIIGAGIFIGSGAVIHATGPAAILSYLLAGLLAMFVARMLGEMATANPNAGSFAEHVRSALGNWGGFATGWLYWYFWVIAIAAEAVGAASILNYWYPDIPVWVMSLGLIILLTVTNIFSVKSFGEIEFWFASIKVAAIISFLLLGTAYILGFWPDKDLSFANLTMHGGFAPHGIASIFQGIVPVMFAVIGTEIVTITAAESENPREAIGKAIKSVIWRIMLFYVGSIFIIICILPWNSEVIGSPYVSVLNILNIPFADQIMNVIVLTALLSALNSGLYISSRMMFGLAKRGDAPRIFLKLNKNGSPINSILFATVIGYLAVIAAYYSPDLVFRFLVNSSGSVVLFVYLLISISQLRNRARLEREQPELLQAKMWAYPYLTYFTIFSILAVLGLMAMSPEMLSQFITSLVSLAVVLIMYGIRRWRYPEVRPENVDQDFNAIKKFNIK